MSYFTYIIYSNSLDKFYVGQTADINTRIEDHNNSRSTYTKKTNDWELKHSEYFDNRTATIHRENEIKKKKSRKYIEWLISK